MRAALLLLALSMAGGDDGSLRVKTDVPGVEILLDGKAAGTTPATIAPLTPGAHKLLLMKPGYEDQAQEVQIPSGAARKVFVVMRPVKTPPPLPAKFFVIHQHRAGACSGVLTLTSEALDYRAHDGKDVFHIPVQQIKSVSRSMGSLPSMYGTAMWNLSAENTGCRIEVPGRSFGFFAYEETNPEAPHRKAEDSVRLSETGPKTKELFDIVYRMWVDRARLQEKVAEGPPQN